MVEKGPDPARLHRPFRKQDAEMQWLHRVFRIFQRHGG
jgi:hypothetical protein